ncbi:TonB-dependent receptor [Paraglaciecola aestuariivivens]
MDRHTFGKSTIALSVAIALSGLSSFQAYAQESNKQEKDQETEVIEVKGFRGSVQKSLNIKRFADTIVDAISAEDVGKFPDQTVADALQRVPGVQVEKSEGESDRVSIRGTAPHLNLTLLNGQNVASATASHSITRASRGFNYSLLPTELIDTLEVHKSAQAKVQEGSVGGTVIVRTRKPLNEEANTMAFSLKDVYQQTSGEHSPTLSGYYSWKSEDENIGFNLGGVLKETSTQRDGLGATGYNHAYTINDATYFTPRDVKASRFSSGKELTTLSSAFQYAFDPAWVLTFTNLYSNVEKENRSITNGVWIGENSYADLTGTPNGDILSAGTVQMNPNDLHSDARWHHYGNRFESRYTTANEIGEYQTKVHDLRLDHSTDNYDLVMQLGITKAEGEIEIRALDFEAQTDASYNIENDNISFSLDSNPTPSDYYGVYIADKNYVNDQQESYFQTDFNYRLDDGVIKSVDLGFKYSDHEKTSRIRLKERFPWFSYNQEYSGSAYLESLYPGFGVQAIDMGGRTNGLVKDFMGGGEHPYLFDFDFSTLDSAFAEVALLRDYWHPGYALQVEEKVSSVYAQANFESGKLKGNAGVRVAKTEQTSTGVDILTPAGWFKWDEVVKTAVPIAVERDYTDVLPSLNLSYTLNDEVILRLAAAKVISRPDYDLLAQRKIYSRAGGIQGNPYLDPTKADQYDLSAEYYFTDSSILSFAVFYKNIRSYVVEKLITADVVLPDDEGVNSLDQDGVLYSVEQMELRTPINGSGGTNKGFEVNVQHDFGNGFGALANYTYQDADMDEEGAVLPNNSDDTFNLSGYYETRDYSARLSYSFRSAYYAGLARSIDRYTDDYGQWDANFNYTINENLSASLQILNLTDENQKSFVKSDSGQQARLAEYNYGRRFYLGISAHF